MAIYDIRKSMNILTESVIITETSEQSMEFDFIGKHGKEAPGTLYYTTNVNPETGQLTVDQNSLRGEVHDEFNSARVDADMINYMIQDEHYGKEMLDAATDDANYDGNNGDRTAAGNAFNDRADANGLTQVTLPSLGEDDILEHDETGEQYLLDNGWREAAIGIFVYGEKPERIIIDDNSGEIVLDHENKEGTETFATYQDAHAHVQGMTEGMLDELEGDTGEVDMMSVGHDEHNHGGIELANEACSDGKECDDETYWNREDRVGHDCDDSGLPDDAFESTELEEETGGPFDTTTEAASDAKSEIGGGSEKGKNFKIDKKDDGYHWDEKVEESIELNENNHKPDCSCPFCDKDSKPASETKEVDEEIDEVDEEKECDDKKEKMAEHTDAMRKIIDAIK